MKKFVAICLVVGLTFYFALVASSENPGRELNNVLFSAESLFKAMKGKDYPAIWKFLTVKSKKAIVKNVHKASAKAGVKYSEEQVSQVSADFGIGGPLSKAYWDSYLAEFDPDMVLEHSRWEMGITKNKKAAIIIHYEKSERPAILNLYKEEEIWKVGLEETFGARNILPK
ncbi:MAG: hypothetical protein ABIK92_21965 [Pseudomonadota bacterium]